jgi:hypothetical protein
VFKNTDHSYDNASSSESFQPADGGEDDDDDDANNSFNENDDDGNSDSHGYNLYIKETYIGRLLCNVYTLCIVTYKYKMERLHHDNQVLLSN